MAANPRASEYLVVWSGEIPGDGLRSHLIHGQRLTAAGAQTGIDDFRISAMSTSERAFAPAVSYDPSADDYLVVWHGDPGPEVFGKRLTAQGGSTAMGDFRVSNMGSGDGDGYGAWSPDVAVDPSAGEYLVVWSADDDTPPLVDNEFEVFGRRFAFAFDDRTRVTLRLAARRIPTSGPLNVQVRNRNEFAVAGRLAGRHRRARLRARAFSVRGGGRKTVKLALPRSLVRLFERRGKLTLRLTAKVATPTDARTVKRRVTVRRKS